MNETRMFNAAPHASVLASTIKYLHNQATANTLEKNKIGTQEKFQLCLFVLICTVNKHL
jgi:hypothetical protein